MASRDLDVLVLGATGFTGRLLAEYLASDGDPDLRIGLAARSLDKLQAVQAEIAEPYPAVADWPRFEVDTSDEDAVIRAAEATTALATTVGPYTRYGLPVVKACAAAGTHYADLSGEVLFMRESIDTYDVAARESGARIVHSCGFDSIPSDLGVWMLHQAVTGDGEGTLEDTHFVLTRMKGGISGGTIASGRITAEEAAKDKSKAKTLADPYSLSPDRSAEPDLGDESEMRTIAYDDVLDTWVAPFLMASINTRVVRRSNALLGHAYGRRFRYSETMGTGPGPKGQARAAAVAAGTGFAGFSQSIGATRSISKKVLPGPGYGPDEATRMSGYFDVAIHATTSTGASYMARVGADADPGYGATAWMLGQAAICLAKDGPKLPDASGVITPATAMGDVLVDRLRAAGMTMSVERTG